MAHGLLPQAATQDLGLPEIPAEQRDEILRAAMSNPELSFSDHGDSSAVDGSGGTAVAPVGLCGIVRPCKARNNYEFVCQ